MEQIFSGYCRCLDSARTVMAELDGAGWEADCDFPGCAFAADCVIGRQIAELKKQEVTE